MKSPLQPCVYPVLQAMLVLLVAALLLPGYARAECKEFKIVEYEDRVEAVCVGEPLTEAQKKADQEEERRQALETQRQRIEEQNRQREADIASKAQTDAETRKRNIQPVTPPQPVNRNTTTNPQILYK
jgi:cobalamin-dependent methionine synthase I